MKRDQIKTSISNALTPPSMSFVPSDLGTFDVAIGPSSPFLSTFARSSDRAEVARAGRLSLFVPRRRRRRMPQVAPMRPAIAWETACFRDCVVHRQRREVTRGGVLQALERRGFDLLVHLLQHHDRVVTKAEIKSKVYDAQVTDAAVSRTLMKVRQAIGDNDENAPLIKTTHGIGYRFCGSLEFDGVPRERRDRRLPASTERNPRLIVMPFHNGTGNPDLAWIELGFMSSIAKALQSCSCVTVAPSSEVMTALRRLPPGASEREKVDAVLSREPGCAVVWGSLTALHGSLFLHFNLRAPSVGLMRGAVPGEDPARMAVIAADRLRAWLSDGETTRRSGLLDLGDGFLSEAFARAVQKGRESRLVEANHLLDVVRDAQVEHPEVLCESARVLASLGAPGAIGEASRFADAARRSGLSHRSATDESLVDAQADHGSLSQAVQATCRAAEVADDAGESDLAVHCMLEAAVQLGMQFDDRAEAYLSRAIPRAERLGSSTLLHRAYFVAGTLAGLRNDWLSAVRHSEVSSSLARSLDEACRAQSYANLGMALQHLGDLNRAVDIGMDAVRSALVCGRQPEIAHSAITALRACFATGRVRLARHIFDVLDRLVSAADPATVVAREVEYRAVLLRAAGRFDEALHCIDVAAGTVAGHAVHQAACQAERVRVLLKARRFDELAAVCERLLREDRPRDRRIGAWIRCAMALRDHLQSGRTREALQSLHDVIETTPVCESSASVSMDAAWIHLERGETLEASRLLSGISMWVEQSGPGLLAAARLRYALGDFDAAVNLQRAFSRRFSEVLTGFHKVLLETYEQSRRDGIVRAIPAHDGAISLEWAVGEGSAQELPASGEATNPEERMHVERQAS